MIVSDDPDLRRLSVRSWRRGTKEMDLILGPYFDRNGADLDAAQRQRFADLLEENDHDIYAWIAGRAEAPEAHAQMVADILAERDRHNISANLN